jgi:hypothetical protein
LGSLLFFLSFLIPLPIVSGPGDWSVQFSSSSGNWFYKGEGQASVKVASNGNYTVTGGANSITGTMYVQLPARWLHGELTWWITARVSSCRVKKFLWIQRRWWMSKNGINL